MEYPIHLVAVVVDPIVMNPVQYWLNEKHAGDQQSNHTMAERDFFLETKG
jgi:hypothetical protein